MPTSSNGSDGGAARSELGFLLDSDGMFAIFCATLNTPREMADPGLVEAAFLEPAFEATPDTPPMTIPESLQEAIADCGTGNAQGEGIGKAPDIIVGDDWCVCLGSLAGGMAAHSPSRLGVCSLLL